MVNTPTKSTKTLRGRGRRSLERFARPFPLMAVLLLALAVAAAGSTPARIAYAANPSASLDQCANDPAPSPSSDGCNSSASQWVNGNLGASKSLYQEGDSIPYRLTFLNLSLASHTVTIEWDTTKSGKHAIDYLTTFNQSVLNANPCLGVSGCSAFSTFAIPADPQVTGAGVTPIAGNFTLYGGTISSVSAYSYADGAGFTGDKSARITITFTASVANPVLAWGGHIATRKDWGLNSSAVAIPGSPYHTRLIDLDGSGGNQDRSLSAEAVIFPGSITIIKDATPNGSTSFSFTGSPSPLTNFSLVDDGTAANTKVFSNITTFTTYSVNETPIPSGWGFDSVSCAVTSLNGGSYTTSTTTVSIAMKEGENWTCTYLDSIRTGTLKVIKHVINDNGGAATAADWSIHVKSGSNEVTGSPQAGSESGTTYTLNAGTYTASETGGPSGYSFTGFSGDCNSSGDVTVVAGQTKTCTLTNDDQQAYVIVVKKVINDNGGSAAPDDFKLTLDGNATTSGTKVAVNPGSYTAGETQLSGYSFTGFSGDCDSSGKVTVALGETKTCTLTNDDQQAYVIVKKVVVNDNGGSAAPDDFKLTLDGNATTSGTKVAVNPGSYTAGETQLSGYSFTGFSDDCDSSGKVTVALGETKTCTLTNDDIPPRTAQITPTGTTCQQFAAGTATKLDTLLYGVKDGKINNVAPGVFFYWVKVTAVVGSNSFTIMQDITTNNFDAHYFAVASGSFVWDANCNKVSVQSISGSGDTTTITFTASAAGTYYIGVKYDASSVVGFAPPTGNGEADYTFTLTGDAGSTEGLALKPK